MKDILILCSDGLTGIKEAISAAFLKTEQQRCIAHMVRNTLKYVSDKDRKAVSTDLKTIYHAANEEKALEALEKVTEKWTPKYPNSMKLWHDNWDEVSPIFKFSMEVRRVICIFLLRIRPFHCFGQCIQRYKGIETRCGGDVFMTEHLLDIG